MDRVGFGSLWPEFRAGDGHDGWWGDFSAELFTPSFAMIVKGTGNVVVRPGLIPGVGYSSHVEAPPPDFAPSGDGMGVSWAYDPPGERPDGSFANPSPLQKEDDPLIATAFAVTALAAAEAS